MASASETTSTTRMTRRRPGPSTIHDVVASWPRNQGNNIEGIVMHRMITVLSGAFLVLFAGCDGGDDDSMSSETEQVVADEGDASEAMTDDR